MGFLDKIKGLLRGNKAQVDKGIDTAAGAAKKAVPDQHDAKVDQAAEKVKDVVGDLTGDDAPAAATTPSAPPAASTPPASTPPAAAPPAAAPPAAARPVADPPATPAP